MIAPASPEKDRRPPLKLRVARLCVERGGRLILDSIAFELGAGEAIAVTGPNGAGKSTLLRAVAGLLPRRSGEIALEGAAEGEAGLALHYLAHADGLRAALSVSENLEFWADYLATPAPAGKSRSVKEALAQVGLAHLSDAPVGFLSAGQKRRVALARLLVAHRPVWLLDEPLTALDVRARGQFAEAMRAHCAAGGMILAATHEPLGLAAARELALEPRRAA